MLLSVIIVTLPIHSLLGRAVAQNVHCLRVAPTPWGTGARPPTFTNRWARGWHRE